MDPRPTIKHVLTGKPGSNLEDNLHRLSGGITLTLKEYFGKEYAVKADGLEPVKKDWTNEITVRQGMSIGAGVDLKWDDDNPTIVEVEVGESTKLGNTVMLAIAGVFLVAGIVMGAFDIEPLAFLPGKKIAGLLGGLIAVVPGIIVALIVKSMLLRGKKPTNEKLADEVYKVVNHFLSDPMSKG